MTKNILRLAYEAGLDANGAPCETNPVVVLVRVYVGTLRDAPVAMLEVYDGTREWKHALIDEPDTEEVQQEVRLSWRDACEHFASTMLDASI